MCAPSQIILQIYHSMLVPCHGTKPSFIIFMRVLDLQELKTKFLNVSNPATTPRILNFIPISCMEPRNLPEDTHVIFQPTLVHWNMCLYFKFELCTQRWHVPSQNHEPSWEKLRFARSLYQNLFLFGQFFYQGMVLPWHDTMPSFMILKPSFSMFSTEPRCPDVWILFSFFAWDLLPPSIYIGPNVFFKTAFDYWQD